MDKYALCKSTVRRARFGFLCLLLIVVSFTIGSRQVIFASSDIVVNSFIDKIKSTDGLCTLREAIIAANKDKKSGYKPGECPAGHGHDTIILPAGTYLLTRTNEGDENASQTGDLDILDDLTLIGEGAATTIVDGSGISGRIIHALSGDITISGVTLQKGSVTGNGGALYNSAELALMDISLVDSQATGSGGGLYNAAGSLTATAVTIANNVAQGNGGGVKVAGGSATFNNSTISGNSADDGSSGMYVQANTDLYYSTVVGDTTVVNSSFSIDSTILAGTCTGTITSAGYNLIQSTNCTVIGDTTGNILGQAPGLDSLASNGGSTQTHALLPESPAIDAGNNLTCPATDQRGIDRPQGLTCDIGAFESENAPQTGETLVVNTAGDVDDGVCAFAHCSLREAINLANVSATSNKIHFAIPGGNPPAIYPQSPLPVISDPILIDGTTQPGGWVVIDGSQAGPAVNGLEITSGDSTISGLQIINFTGSGIWISTNGNNGITGNEIANNGDDGVTILDSTGNQITQSDIHDNGDLSIDLGGDGRTENDIDDPDVGANFIQNFPALIIGVPNENSMHVTGRLNSTPDSTFRLEFFAGQTCPTNGGGQQVFLGTMQANTDGLGNVYFVASGLTAAPLNHFIHATATDENNNTSEISDCISVSPGNTSWVTALPLSVVPDLGPAEVQQFLDQPGQSRWFKFTVEPGSKIIVTLTDLPENYDLTIYRDIAQAFKDLSQPQDLPQLDAEFAADAFSPEVFSPEVFSPEAFSPEAFSPEVFSPEVFSPEVFSPEVFSPEVFSADAFSPEVFSPEVFSPEVFSPEVFSPEVFSPEVFSGAQLRSLLGASAFPGTANEGIILNSWNNTGDFYIRVRGANGAYSAQSTFHLGVEMQSSSCTGISDQTFPPANTIPVEGDYQTIILTDMARMAGSATEKANLAARLVTFANRPEVAGVIVDVGADDRVMAANVQADAHPACPFAKNLVAGAIKEIVDGFHALNPLAYVVIVGSDGVIPFYRYPDNALLANENNYVPPVKDNTASQASLRLGYVLGQDEYGAQTAVSFKNSSIPIPGLAVGRLVETAAQATVVLDAYLGTSNGVTPLNTPPLVTGYDFLEDVALAVQHELETGTGLNADTLIADRFLAPADPAAWTADDLRDKLLGSRHDIAFLAGHFSASGALAADYTTRMTASELIDSPLDMTNMMVFSAGCHSSYNIVDDDGVPFVTEEPDWAEAFASKGALFIGGTGYQYGDTDFLEYSERLYLEFSRALRSGNGPVSAGQALVLAKQQYLLGTPVMRGIHEKVLLQSAIFGIPHLSVDMTGRITPPPDDSVVGPLTLAGDPGNELGLSFADISIMPTFIEHNVEMDNVTDSNPITGFYLSAADGRVASNPAEPTLPLELLNVGVNGNFLRGVGFRGATYTDLDNIVPFTGAPTTEIRGVHAPFQTDVLFPVKFWNTNYYGQLVDPIDGNPYLAVTPAQFVSDGPGALTGTMRRFDNLDFRLYYNNNVTTYAGESQPAQSAPPTIVQVISTLEPDAVNFAVDVVGNPAAGIQEVWVVYTAITGPFFGQWQSLDLTRHEMISSRWEGMLPLNGADPLTMRYMVQAVNGVGLTSLAANVGDLYVPGINMENGEEGTTVLLVNSPAQGVYGSQIALTASLSSNDGPLVNERLTFGLGPQSRSTFTNDQGEATVSLTLLGLPGEYPVRVSFAGNQIYSASAAAATFTVLKQDTVLTLEQPASGFAEEDALLMATLQDADGRYLGEKSVIFVLSGPGGAHSRAVITDNTGRALLGNLPLPPGNYGVTASFSGDILLHTGETLNLTDARYNATTVSGDLTLLNHAPIGIDDSYSTNEDTPLVVAVPGVLANDSDVDGDSLTAVMGQQPADGNVTLNADGSFSYTPDAGFFGIDHFTYFASDGAQLSAEVTVAIIVIKVNQNPDCSTAMATPRTLWPPDKEFYEITITDYFDPDGDALALTVTAIFQDEPVGSGQYSPDAQGIGTDTPEIRAQRDGNGDGRVYHIFFTVEDGFGGSCSGVVRVAIVHDQGMDFDLIDGGPIYDSTIPD